MTKDTSYKPFTINVAEDVLIDLKERLIRTRWPNEPAGPAWTYGTSLAYMKDVVRYWAHEYDWRVWEARLNQFPNYHAMVNGKRVHFLMEKGSGPSPMPLLLSHGWPGSVAEFLDVIEPLAHPERFGGDVADAFTVIAPSLPGYGFSDPPDQPISHREIASIFHKLMTENLDIKRYMAQGGDVGATVTSWIAHDFPEDLIAMHLNLVAFEPRVPETEMTEEEKRWKNAHDKRREGEAGYQQIQGTKPLTLAYGLTDSPAGLAAWILEKFHGWTTPGVLAPPPFPLDHLLCNIMLHWLPGPNAPTWTYKFNIDGSARILPGNKRLDTPTGLLMCPQDIRVPPPDSWVKRVYNVEYRHDTPTGGHFAAFELGPIFVKEVRKYFRTFRPTMG
jgi:microsomal epoxide hydrolase